VGEFLRVLPLTALAVCLAVMWRGGFRGEVTRVVLVAALLFLGSLAVDASTGLLSVMLCSGTLAAYVALIIKRKATAVDEPGQPVADRHGYLREAEPVDEPDRVEADRRYDSGGLADYVRRQQERRAS
jgi:hypothetical protein